jgi:WD40 repeat protein
MKKLHLLILFLIYWYNCLGQKSELRLVLPIGHTDIINCATFSPDGKFALTTSRDKSAKLWDVNRGFELLSFEGHDGLVNFATFSNNGKLIATTSTDKTIRLWNAKSGELVRELIGHKKTVTYANFSFDDKKILTSSHDGSVRIWNVVTGDSILCINQKLDWVKSAQFDKKTEKILTYDGRVSLLNAENGEWLKNLRIRIDGISSAELSPDNSMIVIGSYKGTNYLYDFSNGNLIDSLVLDKPISSTKFSCDNKHIVISVGNNSKIWDLKKKRITVEFKGHNASVLHSEFSPDGKKIISTSWDKTSKIWDVKTGKLFTTLKGYSNDVNKAFFHPMENKILSSSLESAKLTQWDLNKISNIHSYTPKLKKWIYSTNYSKNGNLILVTVADSTARILNSKTYEELIRLKGHRNIILNASFSQDGSKVITTSEDKTAKIWDSKTGKLLLTLKEHTNFVYMGSFSNDDKRVVTASGDNTSIIWDANTGEILVELNTKKLGPVYSACFSNNDKDVLTTSFYNTSTIWNSTNGIIKQELKHTNYLNFGAYNNKGNEVITANSSKSAIIWDLEGSQPKMDLVGHKSSVTSSQFHKNDSIIASTSRDNTIRLWNRMKGENICIFIQIDSTDFLAQIPNSFYFGSMNAAKKIHYVNDNLEIINFDQLDIKYNRPDKVLSALGQAFGNPDTLLINSYYRAWQKRIQKLGIDTSSFEDGFSIPQSDFKNRAQIKYEQKGSELTLQIWGKDDDYLLDRYNVWINEVPVFGQKGVSIRDKKINELNTKVTITLSEGDNKIETSVLNVNGIESYRIPLYVRYNPSKQTTEKLFFIGIGIDQYQEPGHDLQYSKKDIRDLTKQLKTKYGNNMVIDTLFDNQVTRENVLELKERLLNSNVNDKVIISFSGHGLLDSQLDYYLATHATNFQNPKENGLPYEDLEWLLDEIPARKKLLLIDACHSGEVDKDELIAIETTLPKGAKGSIVTYAEKPKIGMKNSFELMQELFANVNRGTGATVISAAGGSQFAYEKGNLQNGVFTYSILELMNQKDEIMVSELKPKVGQRVVELTNGLQKPTSRNETIEFDWKVW